LARIRTNIYGPSVAVHHKAGPLVDDDILDPANLSEHGHERVLLSFRVNAPVARVGK
jgi:hypothetical protein